jgi:hypothetical protein
VVQPADGALDNTGSAEVGAVFGLATAICSAVSDHASTPRTRNRRQNRVTLGTETSSSRRWFPGSASDGGGAVDVWKAGMC